MWLYHCCFNTAVTVVIYFCYLRQILNIKTSTTAAQLETICQKYFIRFQKKIMADSTTSPGSSGVYEFTFKHQWSIQNHLLSGITILPWIKILMEHWSDVDWFVYSHRVVFITFISLFNTIFAIIDWFFYHKAIEQQEIHPEPIFILGHPRTGTTHIQNLVAQDPKVAFVDTLQAGFPSGFLCLRQYKWMLEWMVSPTRPMDNMALSLETPAEDEIAINALSGGVSPYMSLMFMRKHREFTKFCSFENASEEELQAWMTSFKWFLKKVTFANGGTKPLVIKSPVHMARLKIFHELFPKARYVFIHRYGFYKGFGKGKKTTLPFRQNYY